MQLEEFPRIYELRDLVVNRHSPDAFFQNFDESINESCLKKKQFLDWEYELQGLDGNAWNHLKAEIKPLLGSRDPERGWQALFDILNQAKAYNYLVSIGCTNTVFVPVSQDVGKKTPDLEGSLGDRKVLCEVKTINVSKDEAGGRNGGNPRCVSTSNQLNEGFFNKLKDDLERAKCQIDAYCTDTGTKRMAYVVINFDDLLHEYANEYEQQINSFIATIATPDLEIVFSIKPPFYPAMA